MLCPRDSLDTACRRSIDLRYRKGSRSGSTGIGSCSGRQAHSCGHHIRRIFRSNRELIGIDGLLRRLRADYLSRHIAVKEDRIRSSG